MKRGFSPTVSILLPWESRTSPTAHQHHALREKKAQLGAYLYLAIAAPSPLSMPGKDQDGFVDPEGEGETWRLRSSLCKQGSWNGCFGDFIPGQGCHKKEKYSVIPVPHRCKRLRIRAQKAWVPATFCFDRTLKCLLESSQGEKILKVTECSK